MKGVKFLVVLIALLVGLSSIASANSCYTVVNVPVVKVKKIYKTYTKRIPYRSCKNVCVPVRDECNRIIRYRTKRVCVTKYKVIRQRYLKGYEHIGYYKGRKVRLFWATRLCTIPVKVPTNCCVTVEDSCNSCYAR